MSETNPTGSRVENFRRNLSFLWQGSQDHNEEHNHQEQGDAGLKKMIAQQAIWAAKVWMVVYGFIFVHGLCSRLIENWKTNRIIAAEYEQKLALMQTQNGPTITTEAPWWVSQQAELETALSEIREFSKLQSAELRKVMQQKEILEEMKVALEELDEKSWTSSLNDATTPFPIEGNVASLLQHASLAEIQSSTELQTSFDSAVQELRNLLHTPEKWNWTMVHESFAAAFPPREPSLVSDDVKNLCASSNDDNFIDSNTNGPIIPPNAAHQSDLEEQIAIFQSYLEQRHGSTEDFSKLVFPDTLSSLERAMQQRIHVILEMIIASAGTPGRKRGSSSSSSCLSSEDVIGIVEEGLAALEQGASLRNVMRKKILELDPTVTSIILDADLTPPIPKIPFRETNNLRRLLDTPLLLQLGSSIDHLVELAGGHNDHLDQWLDSVAGRESVGEMVVRRLLEASGKVEIPSLHTLAKQYLPVKAQKLLKKST